MLACNFVSSGNMSCCCRAWLVKKCWSSNLEELVFLMLKKALVRIQILMKTLKFVSTSKLINLYAFNIEVILLTFSFGTLFYLPIIIYGFIRMWRVLDCFCLSLVILWSYDFSSVGKPWGWHKHPVFWHCCLERRFCQVIYHWTASFVHVCYICLCSHFLFIPQDVNQSEGY